MIEVEGLTVRFAGVTPIDDVSVVFPGFIRDAGMFAESGASLPAGVGTSTPQEVADAVLKGIERDRGELTVAPVAMRAMTTFAEVAPTLSARMAALAGASKVAGAVAEGQREKR